MAKVTLPSIASGYNPATINSNFQIIADQLNNRVLYRVNVGAEPNQMSNLLDMNNFRIINLPEPLSDTEPARKKDFNIFSGLMDAKVAEAQNWANVALGYKNQAQAAAEAAQGSATQASDSAVAVITAGASLTQTLINTGEAQKNALIAVNAQYVTQAENAAVLAVQASVSAEENKALAQQAASTAIIGAEDAEQSAELANQIAMSLAGGTIGFDAFAYDFGYVSDEMTYFNRDFGTLV